MSARIVQARRLSRRSWRCASTAAAVLSLLASAAPALGSSAGAGMLRLTRTVQLTASATGYALVSLPRAVQGPAGFPRLVQSWRGGASAVLLVPDRPDVFDLDNPPPALVIPNLSGRGVNPHPYVFIGLDPRHHEPDAFYHWLPPGRYRLYVIATRPTKVRLRLPGLPAGRTHVSVATPATAHAVGAHHRALAGTLPPAFSFGGTGQLTSAKSLVWSAVWMHSPVRVADADGSCLYLPPPRSPTVYSIPSCAAATSGDVAPSLTREYVGYVPSPDYLAEQEWYVRSSGQPLAVGEQTYAEAGGSIAAEGAEILWLSW